MAGQTIENWSTNVSVLKLKSLLCQTSVQNGKNAGHTLGEGIFEIYILL